MSGLTSRQAPRKGENYELSVDLNSEYRDKRKDAIKRVIASMTVGKGTLQPNACFLDRRNLMCDRC
jgi:vesicle coat complex subunit